MMGLGKLIPEWLLEWFRIYVTPFLKVQARVVFKALLRGITDTALLISLPLTLSISSQTIWNARYHLTSAQQHQVKQWASVSRIIAYMEDVPAMVPLVLWYKENALQTENPANCEGIMGLYTAVQSGELPCFPTGEIGPWEIAYQLQLGARTFKKFCPEISYTTSDPRVLQRCYLYYNAGPASRLDPDDSGYVMNGYDSEHQDMILTDVQGRTYRLQALGAWPVHLAIQAQLAQRAEPPLPPALLAPVMLSQELLDKAWTKTQTIGINGEPPTAPALGTCRAPVVENCFIEPHVDQDDTLRPTTSPLFVAPLEGSALTCDLLPGIELTSPKASLVLAPLSGELTRYTDELGHLALQIENEAWTLWLTGLRSYTAPEGDVVAGQPVGAISGQGSRTPAVHYTLYDRLNAGFVDPLSFIPADKCPPME